jgi:hypothetical protein
MSSPLFLWAGRYNNRKPIGLQALSISGICKGIAYSDVDLKPTCRMIAKPPLGRKV